MNALKLLIQNNDSTKLKTYLKDNNISYSSDIENLENNCGGGGTTFVGVNIFNNSKCSSAYKANCSIQFKDNPTYIKKCPKLQISGNINQENNVNANSTCYITSLLKDKQLVSNRNLNLGLHLVYSNQDLDCKNITNDKILDNINECINVNSILQQNILELCNVSDIYQMNNNDVISNCIINNTDTTITPTPTQTITPIIIPITTQPITSTITPTITPTPTTIITPTPTQIIKLTTTQPITPTPTQIITPTIIPITTPPKNSNPTILTQLINQIILNSKNILIFFVGVLLCIIIFLLLFRLRKK